MLDALPQPVQKADEESRAAPHIEHFPLTPKRADAEDSADEKDNIVVGLMFLPIYGFSNVPSSFFFNSFPPDGLKSITPFCIVGMGCFNMSLLDIPAVLLDPPVAVLVDLLEGDPGLDDRPPTVS